MKRIVIVFSLLVLLSLACATLSGGGDGGNTAGNSTSNSAGVSGDSNIQPAVDSGPTTANPLCYNPFYPLGEGLVYTYRYTYDDPVEGDSEIEEFTISTIDETDDTITVLMAFDEFSSEVTWNCEEGGLFSSEFAQFDFTQFGDLLDIETVSYEGITLPVEEDWYVGNTWDMNYEIFITFSIEEVEVVSHVIGQLDNEIVSIESVSVPAGTYPEAHKVETTGTITVQMDVMGTSVDTDIELDMTSWYVKGVGMVRQESTDISGTTLTELIDIE